MLADVFARHHHSPIPVPIPSAADGAHYTGGWIVDLMAVVTLALFAILIARAAWVRHKEQVWSNGYEGKHRDDDR